MTRDADRLDIGGRLGPRVGARFHWSIYGLYRIVYRLLEEDGVAEVLTVFRSSRPFPLV